MKTGTKELDCHPKTGHVVLSHENVREAYLEWKDGLITHKDTEELPDDYDRVEKYSEHLTTAVARPVLDNIPMNERDRERALQTQIR